DMDLLCIDHCREGRIEQEVGQNAFSYLEAGDLRVDRRIHHSGKVEFPLCHYHGISIGFQMETAAKEIPASMKGFSVDLYELQKKYCSDRTPYVIPGEPAIEHIFSELYNVPVKIKKDYFKIKVLELLLYLGGLEPGGRELTRYGSQQTARIQEIHALLTEHLDRRYTIEELSRRYLLNTSTLKEVFKAVYGLPIATYMKEYRVRRAMELLRESGGSIAAIAAAVGYESQGKFTRAFKDVTGQLPTEYRREHRG
ncbi:MAG: helix-turn-helix transcriptional regulator, partial [Oscillibacter sp.]|nr:helix-turn-helix transcriptional regulator [Oscillibacter sp.]